MSEYSYTYNILTDFPNGIINTTKLKLEIDNSSINTVLNRIDTNDNIVYIVFNNALTANEKLILDGNLISPSGGLIAVHDGLPYEISNYTETLYPRIDNSKSTSWKTMIKYNINGTIHELKKIQVMSYMDAGVTSYNIRIYDITNKVTISEKTFTNTIEELYNMGPLSNIPINNATLELQLKINSNGSKKGYIDFIIFDMK